MAVDPPTRPVPPRTRTLELRIFSGRSGSLVAVAVAVILKFKLRGSEIGAIEFTSLCSALSTLCLISFLIHSFAHAALVL